MQPYKSSNGFLGHRGADWYGGGHLSISTGLPRVFSTFYEGHMCPVYYLPLKKLRQTREPQLGVHRKQLREEAPRCHLETEALGLSQSHSPFSLTLSFPPPLAPASATLKSVLFPKCTALFTCNRSVTWDLLFIFLFLFSHSNS